MKKLLFISIIILLHVQCKTTRITRTANTTNTVTKKNNTSNNTIKTTTKPIENVTNTTASSAVSLQSEFNKYSGTPYKYGGTTSNGFDCSGFVNTVYWNVYKIDLPRSTQEIKKLGRKISKSALQIGDLVFFKPENRYNHVAIYVGNGVIMHSTTSKGVIKSNLENSYWKKYYLFSKRISK